MRCEPPNDPFVSPPQIALTGKSPFRGFEGIRWETAAGRAGGDQLLELMIAIVATVILFPLLAMAGIALKRGVRGPVILHHERSG